MKRSMFRKDENGERTQVHFTREGVVIRRECPRCGDSTSILAPTVAGVPVGRHRCTKCGGYFSAEPEAILAAMDRDASTIEGSQRADAQHRLTPFRPSELLRSLLTYRGVELRNDDPLSGYTPGVANEGAFRLEGRAARSGQG